MEEMLQKLSEILFGLSKQYSINITQETLKLLLNLLFATSFISITLKLGKSTLNFFYKQRAKYDLHPIIDKVEVDNATKFYIPTKGQNVSASNETEPGYTQAFTVKNELIPFFLKAIKNKKNVTRHYLILADSGMGKTTFLINLYLKYKRLISLKKYQIQLLPLAHPDIETLIHDINNQENTILLLDGFDEDTKAVIDYNERIKEITKKTYKFRKIFITSRTQFFPSENLEPSETFLFKYSLDGTTQHYFKKIYLSPFDDDDVNKYIGKKFPLWKFWKFGNRNNAKKIIELCPNLMVRPMLLSYIDDLVDKQGRTEIALAEKEKIYLTSSDIYKILIDRWIQREGNRVEISRRDNFIESMYKFSKEIAIYIFKHRQSTLNLDSGEIIKFAKGNDINLSEIELKGKSLLNRDANGKYKFAHKSILEYFLAVHAIENKEFGDGTLYFSNMKNFDQAASFCAELDMKKN